MKTVLRYCLAIISEYCHRQLLDNYLIHPEFYKKNMIIIPKWKAILFKLILKFNYQWRHSFHDLSEHCKKSSSRYDDSRDFYRGRNGNLHPIKFKGIHNIVK